LSKVEPENLVSGPDLVGIELLGSLNKFVGWLWAFKHLPTA